MWQSDGARGTMPPRQLSAGYLGSQSMSEYTATVYWQRHGAVFTDNKYSRAHQWRFDGGVTVPASSSPHVVRVPLSDPSAVDPEEAFVASLSSCHMLFFLMFAAQAGFVVDAYEDQAIGTMAQGGLFREAAQPRAAGSAASSLAR
jgi:organic hydroperoxide reductase OsmC/OhrA